MSRVTLRTWVKINQNTSHSFLLPNCNIMALLSAKAVNREDKRSRRYRDRHFAKFERSRRYRDR
jgi:hypothetical protein